ncbi:MAG: hypothetical protein ACLUHE_01970 [Christensenellales bacterium]
MFDAYRAQKTHKSPRTTRRWTVEVINDESRLLVAESGLGTSVVQPSDFYDGEIDRAEHARKRGFDLRRTAETHRRRALKPVAVSLSEFSNRYGAGLTARV